MDICSKCVQFGEQLIFTIFSNINSFHMIYKCVISYYFHLLTSEMLCSKKKKKGRSGMYGHLHLDSNSVSAQNIMKKKNVKNLIGPTLLRSLDITRSQHVVLNSELKVRSSLVVHPLGLGTSNCCGLGSVPDWGTKILQATCRGKKENFRCNHFQQFP